MLGERDGCEGRRVCGERDGCEGRGVCGEACEGSV